MFLNCFCRPFNKVLTHMAYLSRSSLSLRYFAILPYPITIPFVFIPYRDVAIKILRSFFIDFWCIFMHFLSFITRMDSWGHEPGKPLCKYVHASMPSLRFHCLNSPYLALSFIVLTLISLFDRESEFG